MPCYGNIPEGDEIVAHWADDDRVAIFNFLDDIGQPFSCEMWGNEGTAEIPVIVDDGTGHTFHDLFELALDAYPVNVFLDHEMNVVNITEAEMNQTAVNNVIQGMVENLYRNYDADIQPIFDNNCIQCHGSIGGAGGLSLANYSDLMSSSVVTIYDGEGSTIYERMIDSIDPMPQSGLLDASIAEKIKTWINHGACGELLDNCDVCDSDPTNDCEQDCNGEWGGTSLVDTCGVCDGDGTSCLSIDNHIPQSLSINNIYPNPFNPVVNIEYSLSTADLLNISIYDLNGQFVNQLFSGHQSVGNYQITWHASEMSSGIYFIMIQSGNVELSNQLILLK